MIDCKRGLALFLLVMTPATPQLAAAAPPSPRPSSRQTDAPPAAGRALVPAQLYSRRALRQAQAVLRLRLLEVRAENLTRVRAAVERDLLERQVRPGADLFP